MVVRLFRQHDIEAGEGDRTFVVSLGSHSEAIEIVEIFIVLQLFRILGVRGDSGMFPEIPIECAKLCQAWPADPKNRYRDSFRR
jgi:hypothetical protein